MRLGSALTAVAIATLAILVGCGEKGGGDGAGDKDGGGLFPARIASGGLQRVAEPRTFVGDSLWEYIDGGAEIYHSYGFVDVSTAEYKAAAVEIVADVYRFATPEEAYGLYSYMRPDDPQVLDLGVQGYFTGQTLEFVKGDRIVRLTGFVESAATTAALDSLAGHFDAAIAGTTARPATLALFPADGMIPNTDKMVAAAFLGQAELRQVYTCDYIFGEQTVTLFLSEDKSGAKFLRWREDVARGGNVVETPAGLPYDEGYYLAVNDDFYGLIVGGLCSGYLAGAINFSPGFQTRLTDWLQSLK